MQTGTTCTIAAIAALSTAAIAQQSADFEDIAAGTPFLTGDVFASQGVNIAITDLVTTGFTTSGAAEVFGPASDMAGPALTPSNELQPNNVTANFTFDQVYTQLSFEFGTFGGVNTFEINGDKREFTSFASLFAATPTIGGVTFTLAPAAPGFGERGTITGIGSFNAVSIGGQELFLDNVRVVPTPGAVAAVGLAGLVAARRRRYA